MTIINNVLLLLFFNFFTDSKDMIRDNLDKTV